MLTIERLKELLDYYPHSGLFVRRKSLSSKTKVGDIAGTINGRGYVQLYVDGVLYLAHRLAWFYMNEEWPDNIDHINHFRSDNRWCNLRSVTHHENQKNKPKTKRNSSGVNGVRWAKDKRKWIAFIGLNGKTINLGGFIDKFDAICCRKSAESKHGYHANHGS